MLFRSGAAYTTGMSKQHFYNCLYRLEEKGFVSIHKQEYDRFNLIVNGNKFKSENDTTAPYLKLNFDLLNSGFFHSAKKGLKVFLLRSLSFASRKWTVTKDMLKSYGIKLTAIEPFCAIKQVGDKYIVSLNESLKTIERTAAEHGITHKMMAYLNRIKIAARPVDEYDFVRICLTHKHRLAQVSEALHRSLEIKDTLEPKLISYFLKQIKVAHQAK